MREGEGGLGAGRGGGGLMPSSRGKECSLCQGGAFSFKGADSLENNQQLKNVMRFKDFVIRFSFIRCVWVCVCVCE